MSYLVKWFQARGETVTLQPARTLMSAKLILPARCPWGFNNESYPAVVEEDTSESKISIRSSSITEVSDSRFTEGPFLQASWSCEMRSSLCMGLLRYWEVAHGFSSSNHTFIHGDYAARNLEEGLWFIAVVFQQSGRVNVGLYAWVYRKGIRKNRGHGEVWMPH